MSRKSLIVLVIIVAIAAGAGGYFLAVHNSGKNIVVFTTTTAPYEERDLQGKIDYLAESPSAEDYDKMIELQSEYNSLTDGEKAKIGNYPTLEKLIEQAKPEKRKLVINEINTLKEDLSDENQAKILALIIKYKPLLTQEDIEAYLSYGIHSRVLKDAEKTLKKSLKKPDSYKRRKYEIREYAYRIDKKGYEIKVDLSYSAKNSYGKVMKNSRTVYCYYKFDKKSKTGIKLKSSNLSSLDKWKMEH